MAEPVELSVIVRVVTRWLLGLTLTFALALALYGHVTPGGGFAGGVVVASGFVLAYFAFGGQGGPAQWMARVAPRVDGAGALLFLGLGLGGFLQGHFLQAWLGRGTLFTLGSTPFVVLLNLAILLKVGGGLFAGFMEVSAFQRLAAPAPGEGNGS